MSRPFRTLGVALIAIIASVLFKPIQTRIRVLGVIRWPSSTPIADGDFVVIPDTKQCEDLHHFAPANLLFTACEDVSASRCSWFPPFAVFKKPPPASYQGSIHIIDPKAMTSKRLSFEAFVGSFVTHGIDVIADPTNSSVVYIFAVNHLPHPEFAASRSNSFPTKARSQIEIFRHVLRSKTAKHVRSILHPLIYTPNDIYAVSPTSFYVTNDHYYRDGFLREIEDTFPTARWSNIVHVDILDSASRDPEAGINASVALTGLHNNNGLGHGRSEDEVLIGSAASGMLHRAKRSHHGNEKNLTVVESIQLDSTIDNPTYYADPYATPSGDASGYIIAGLARGIDTMKTKTDPKGMDPVMVWHARKIPSSRRRAQDGPGVKDEWKKRLIFEDDGTRIRLASVAVMVPIDPEMEKGAKMGWLFVTGVLSESVVAIKIDLGSI